MKKIISLTLIVAALLAMTSCTQGKYKDFATRVAAAAARNDTAALKTMIYGGKQLNFAHFTMAKLDVSKAKMIKLDEGGYTVDWGKQYLVIKPVYGDSLQVVAAGKVFTCNDPVMLAVAQQRGIVDASDDDITVLRGFSSHDFSIVWKQHVANYNNKTLQAQGQAVANQNIDELLTKLHERINGLKGAVKQNPDITGTSAFYRGMGELDDLEQKLELQRRLMSASQAADFASLQSSCRDFRNSVDY